MRISYANMRLLAWDLTGSALAYADWDTLVSLFLGRAKKEHQSIHDDALSVYP